MRQLLGRQDARAFSDAFSGAFSDWSTGVRRLFRKDAAFRTWQWSSAWFGETDVSWHTFKAGPWQRIQAKHHAKRATRSARSFMKRYYMKRYMKRYYMKDRA